MSLTGPNPTTWQSFCLVIYGLVCLAMAPIFAVAYAFGPLFVIGVLVGLSEIG
jgi:hypothetical protein